MPDRVSGILLHPTSLPGPHGIGELGDEAVAFAGLPRECRPAAVAGAAARPHRATATPRTSASPRSPATLCLISLDAARRRRAASTPPTIWPARAALPRAPSVEYGAADRVQAAAAGPGRARLRASDPGRASASAFERFWRGAGAAGCDDFALFMALKECPGGRAWHAWEREAAPAASAAALERRPARSTAAAMRRAQAVAALALLRQWTALRAHARRARACGSSATPHLRRARQRRRLGATRSCSTSTRTASRPSIAGVPPDYFSDTGQLWGNPLYRWDAHRSATASRGGSARFRATLDLFDRARASTTSAASRRTGRSRRARRPRSSGRWVHGPGAGPLRRPGGRARATLPIVAEDLGVITPEVEALRDRLRLPGNEDPAVRLRTAARATPSCRTTIEHELRRLHRHARQRHDGRLVREAVGARGAARRWSRRRYARARTYRRRRQRDPLGLHPRRLQVSVAETVHRPAAGRARAGQRGAHEPARARQGNWRWRYLASDLTPAIRARLRALCEASARVAERESGSSAGASVSNDSLDPAAIIHEPS